MSDNLNTEIARLNAIMDRLDMRFVEAAHYERDDNCKPMSLAQTPVGGSTTNVEMYASTQINVLAYPVLYCLVHGEDHACAHTHKVDATIGVCESGYAHVKPEQYQPSDRVQATADKSYTGTLSRTGGE